MSVYSENLKYREFRSGWCGSVGWVTAYEPRFYSQAGHVPGLQAKSPVGAMQEATKQCFSPSLFFFPSTLS